MSSPAEMAGGRFQFMWALQALAQPAEVQFGLFPSFACVGDELALDYGNWTRWYQAHHSVTAAQADCLRELALVLAEIRGDAWLDTGLRSLAIWDEVRAKAAQTLVAFGWKAEMPPSGRSLYARGG